MKDVVLIVTEQSCPCQFISRSDRFSDNVNKRSISFVQVNARVECNYDYMGRQYLRKVYKNGDSYPTINERYIHCGYLRLGALNMNNGADFYQALLNNDGTYYYGHDFNKHVTEFCGKDLQTL